MAIDPGKYDDICFEVRKHTQALGVLLVVAQGRSGDGVAIQATYDVMRGLPEMLRSLAKEIEKDIMEHDRDLQTN